MVTRERLTLTTYKRWNEGSNEQEIIARTALRYIFSQELTALLNHHGFGIERQYGDWNQEPLDATSISIITRCRKPSAASRAWTIS